jgi:hypothetical protein
MDLSLINTFFYFSIVNQYSKSVKIMSQKVYTWEELFGDPDDSDSGEEDIVGIIVTATESSEDPYTNEPPTPTDDEMIQYWKDHYTPARQHGDRLVGYVYDESGRLIGEDPAYAGEHREKQQRDFQRLEELVAEQQAEAEARAERERRLREERERREQEELERSLETESFGAPRQRTRIHYLRHRQKRRR